MRNDAEAAGIHTVRIEAPGKHVWDAADKSPITRDDVLEASVQAVAAQGWSAQCSTLFSSIRIR